MKLASMERICVPGVVALFLFVFGCGSVIDSVRNDVEEEGPAVKPSGATRALHESLLIADLHADPLFLGRDLVARSDHGHVDIPRLIHGNVALQGFGVVTRAPWGILSRRFDLSDKDDIVGTAAKVLDWPEDTHESEMARALYMAGELHAFEIRSRGRFRIIRNREQLQAYRQDRQINREMTAGFLALEGAHALEGESSSVAVLKEAGFRIIGLVHFFDNEVGGSAHGVEKGGLTEFGREVIREIARLDLIVDLAHASRSLIEDVVAFIDRMPVDDRPPVLVSHTGVRETCDNDRNLSLKQLKRIREVENDVLIGIGFFEDAVCGKRVIDIANAIRLVADSIGIRNVALGSDWDGFVPVPMDAGNLAKLTHVLRDSLSLPASTIDAVMGRNTFDFFERALPVD